MARLVRVWEKKRGDRRTGSPMVGGAGEALFFAALFLVGSVALAELVTSQVAGSGDNFLGGWGLWLLLLVLVSFIVIGAGGVIYTVLRVGTSAERRSAFAKRAGRLDLLRESKTPSSAQYPTVPDDENFTNSPGITLAYRLPLKAASNWKLVAAAAICLVLNGIVSVLAVLTLNGHLAGKPDWLSTLFLVPFGGIGFWTMYYFFRELLLATGIGPTNVEISDHPLVPGQRYSVFVSQAGRLSVRTLEVLLACDEEATYREGTDSRVETRRVYERTVFQRDQFEIRPGGAFEHQCELVFPSGVMHSFQSDHNTIQWKLIVKGEAARWPPYERTFPVVVHPAEDARDNA